MDDDNKENINKEEQIKTDEKQSEGEKPPEDQSSAPVTEQNLESVDQNQPTNENQQNESANEDLNKDKVEEKKEHEVIHKKDGRLHIYIRQDKYKGELKSKNWVGRLYIDGKQKIFSSGTPNIEEAIPILEKWFDDVHAAKEKESLETSATQQTAPTPEQTTSAPEQPATTEQTVPPVQPTIGEEKKIESVPTNQNLSSPSEKTEQQVEEATKVTMLNIIAILKEAVGGDLNKVKKCVQLIGVFNTPETYTQHAMLMNAASDLTVEIFGEKGKHTRNTSGAYSLPVGSSVSIQAIFEVE